MAPRGGRGIRSALAKPRPFLRRRRGSHAAHPDRQRPPQARRRHGGGQERTNLETAEIAAPGSDDEVLQSTKHSIGLRRTTRPRRNWSNCVIRGVDDSRSGAGVGRLRTHRQAHVGVRPRVALSRNPRAVSTTVRHTPPLGASSRRLQPSPTAFYFAPWSIQARIRPICSLDSAGKPLRLGRGASPCRAPGRRCRRPGCSGRFAGHDDRPALTAFEHSLARVEAEVAFGLFAAVALGAGLGVDRLDIRVEGYVFFFAGGVVC